ncbi:MAG TPA: ABC transporter substrate-binding protein [Acetobacteraceae bacterium]|nr:ABC transporter substrate-binding protein [Acetobacteraceae bacterium]
MNQITRRAALAGAAAALAAPAIVRAAGEEPIRIGEINSYSAIPAFTLPYRKGWEMALTRINNAGGVLGRKLEIISRDDAGKPADAIRLAGELVNEQKVDLLAGGFLSNIGLALSDFANHANKLYVAGEPLADALVWQDGNATCFRLRPSTYMQVAMLVPDALALKAKRWATVAPNYEYGQSAVHWFETLMKERQPDIEFVAEQWPALGHIDAGATVGALEQAKPNALFNVTFGADLTNFVRQGNTRGLFQNRPVVSLLTGEPEYLIPLGADTPVGWIVTGYPVEQDRQPANLGFVNAYTETYKEPPRMGSVVGYALVFSIAAGIARAGGLETAQLEKGFAGASFDTPFGTATYRPIDHQSTMGTFVGKLALVDGKGTMTDWRYVDGATVMPPDDVVAKLRK